MFAVGAKSGFEKTKPASAEMHVAGPEVVEVLGDTEREAEEAGELDSDGRP